MKRIIFLSLFMSWGVMASEHCHLSIHDIENEETILMKKEIEADEHELNSVTNAKTQIKHLNLNYQISGLVGDEYASFSLVNEEKTSEEILLRGNESREVYFDEFVLKVSCELKKGP